MDAYVSVPAGVYPGGLKGREQVEEMLDILFRRKWLIMGVFLLVFAGTAVYSLRQTPIYETRSLIMVDLGRTSLSKAPGEAGVGENLFATNERSLSGELFVIQSSTRIAERVRERLNGPQRGYVRFEPASSSVNAISVVGVSSDPKQAATLANLYAEEYVQLTRDASRTHMSSSREFLEEQEETRRQELYEAEARVKNYIEEHGAVALDDSGARLVAEIDGLQSRLDEARIELGTREGSLEALEQELKTLSPQLADRIASRLDLKIQAVQTKLAELEVAKEEILLHNPGKTESELSNTRLPEISGQIEKLQAELAGLSQKYVDEVASTGGISSGEQGLSYVAELKRRTIQERISINGLRERIEVMRSRIQEASGRLESIPGQSVELARLQRAKAQAEEMYSYVVQQLQARRIQEGTEPGYAHVLRSALVPTRSVSPDHRRNFILGGFFGIMLALGLALVRDKLDSRIYKPDAVREEGHEVLGVIPDMKELLKQEFEMAERADFRGKRYATSLVSLLRPFSMISESYRHIRTKVQFSMPDQVVQTILVTSPGIGEGKSTTAANLAVVMAEADRRTLLIDADLRRPQVSDLFGVGAAPCLVELLQNAIEPSSGALETDVENLSIIRALPFDTASGTGEIAGQRVPVRPAELLGSAQMRDFLRKMRDQFDVIIIDAPPVMAATDAAVLSTQCDATVVVAQAGRTKEAELDDAVETIENVGGRIIGILLNKFDVSLAYGQTYKYDHYSKYGLYSRYDEYAGAGVNKRRAVPGSTS